MRTGWKAFERRLAADCGGRRIPVTGIDRNGADVTHPLFHFQLKLRKSIPVWLWGWLAGIVGTATDAGKIGVLVLKRPRQRDTEALVVLRWADWVALHGTNAQPEGQGAGEAIKVLHGATDEAIREVTK
jgi:hypothetical protein